jgi:cytoskeletal protein RodZ
MAELGNNGSAQHRVAGDTRTRSHYFHVLTAILAVFAIALIGAGCGNDESSADSTSIQKPALEVPQGSVSASRRSRSGSTDTTGSTGTSDSGTSTGAGTTTGGANSGTGTGTDTGGQGTAQPNNGGQGTTQQNTGGAAPGQ